eukprot:9489468-Pyramimonas_sp.AAC.1
MVSCCVPSVTRGCPVGVLCPPVVRTMVRSIMRPIMRSILRGAVRSRSEPFGARQQAKLALTLPRRELWNCEAPPLHA